MTAIQGFRWTLVIWAALAVLVVWVSVHWHLVLGCFSAWIGIQATRIWRIRMITGKWPDWTATWRMLRKGGR